MQVVGIIGALDPHTHKLNQAKLSGEGKLEEEGVRPQRQGPPPAHQTGAMQLGTLGMPVLSASFRFYF
jgi:FKBP12-rapamycin complex-associated protein